MKYIKKNLISIFTILAVFDLHSQTFIMPDAAPHKNNENRITSNPYISGDSFRAIADFIIDETAIAFDSEQVKSGDIIFLKTDYLDIFFTQIHPLIPNPYILVTHNSDYGAPGNYKQYLDDPKLLAWFGQNADVLRYPKFFAIPIGLANKHWGHGNIDEVTQARQYAQTSQRTYLVYLNFSDNTNSDRPIVRKLFQDKPFCYAIKGHKKHKEYLKDLAHSKFAFSPEGEGLDCHRTWEILLMGAIPIIKHSTLDSLFEKLPVVLIDKWTEITQDFLERKYKEISNHNNFDINRMFLQYWIDKILTIKQQAQQK